ncbi:hypothetical protein Gotur_029614 [Gossypium turneri]
MLGKLSSRRFMIVLKRIQQGEQEEPTEPKTEKSTNKTETEADSVIDTEEGESDKEPNSPRPEFPNAIFETWTEDNDDASGDGTKEDKGNESEK